MNYIIRLLLLSGMIAFSMVASTALADNEKLPRSAQPAPNDSSQNNWWTERFDEKLKEVKERGDEVRMVFLGDSITQHWEGAGAATWEAYYEPRNAINLGFSADRTERVLWRIQNGHMDGLSPELIVLMIGTNNSFHHFRDPAEDIATGVKAILDDLETRAPEAKVLLLGIFPSTAHSSNTPKGWMQENNRAANKLMAEFGDEERVFYRDIGHAFKDEDGKVDRDLMPDGLHLSGRGYKAWAQAMEPHVEALMGE